ncbi:MAG: DUF4126 domain-containing protein [Syntrophobacteraceae bacterium]|jgi:hypothetical protein|nr:DUF4126 domain-containing protein [Syntrophobacteraceae bacterium]
MEIIAKLGTLLGLSFVSGINLYATIAVVGVCKKYELVRGLPGDFDVLANDAVIFVAVLLYLLEFLVDKIPGLDSLWDFIHTLIRPLGGAMLALMQVGEATPALEIIVFMLGASLASAAHVTKAGTRLIINTSPEPVSNFLVSLAEDAGAFTLAYLSLAHPTLSLVITVGMLTLIAVMLPVIFRTIRMLFSAIWARLKCALWKEAAWTWTRSPSYDLDAFFDEVRTEGEKLIWTARAYALRLPQVPRSTALDVLVTTRGIHLRYRRRLRRQSLTISREEIDLQRIYHGILMSRWVIRGPRGDWYLNVYRPLAQTIPMDLEGMGKNDGRLEPVH